MKPHRKIKENFEDLETELEEIRLKEKEKAVKAVEVVKKIKFKVHWCWFAKKKT